MLPEIAPVMSVALICDIIACGGMDIAACGGIVTGVI